MKIISKYKDYYDYLVGEYGQDEKLVLDRRGGGGTKSIIPNNTKFILYICDFMIEGLYLDGNYHYGDSLLKFQYHGPKWMWYLLKNRRNAGDSFIIESLGEYFSFYLEPFPDHEKTNIKSNCPILLKTTTNTVKYPCLKYLGLPSFIGAATIYNCLSRWLGERINDRENIKEDPPDKLKLELKGFDKRSFRPKMP